MAVTTEKSTQYAAEYSAPSLAAMDVQTLKMEILPFKFTQGSAAGDATSTAMFRRLPAGLVYFFPFLSRIQWDDMGTTPELDIGHGAYTEPDGDAVTADDNEFDDAIDTSSAGEAAMGSDYVHGTAGDTGGYHKFWSKEGVDIFGTGPDEGIPANCVLQGYLVIGRPA